MKFEINFFFVRYLFVLIKVHVVKYFNTLASIFFSKLNEGLPDFFQLKYLLLEEFLVHVFHYLVHGIEITQEELQMY